MIVWPTMFGLMTTPGAALSLSLASTAVPGGEIYNPFAALAEVCDGPIGTGDGVHFAEVHCFDGTPLAVPVGASWSATYAGAPAGSGANGGPCDLNQDGFTDGADYDAFTAAFENGEQAADFNVDGFIDGIDYDQWMFRWETEGATFAPWGFP